MMRRPHSARTRDRRPRRPRQADFWTAPFRTAGRRDGRAGCSGRTVLAADFGIAVSAGGLFRRPFRTGELRGRHGTQPGGRSADRDLQFFFGRFVLRRSVRRGAACVAARFRDGFGCVLRIRRSGGGRKPETGRPACRRALRPACRARRGRRSAGKFRIPGQFPCGRDRMVRRDGLNIARPRTKSGCFLLPLHFIDRHRDRPFSHAAYPEGVL